MSTSVYETRSVEKTSRWTEALIWTAQLNGTERLELNMCAIGVISNSFSVFLSCCPTGLQVRTNSSQQRTAHFHLIQL